MRDITLKRPGWENWPSPRELQELYKKADGLFHYAAIALQWIKQWIDKNGMAHRDKIFEALTREGGLDPLEDLYRIILISFEDIHKPAQNAGQRADRLAGFQHVIGTILVLRKPLTIWQITGLLADISKDDFDVTNFLPQFRSVLIPGTTTSFEDAIPQMHKSFRDYITSDHPPDGFRIRTGHAHFVTARSCLEVIVKGGTQADVHWEYSVGHWHKHLRRAVELAEDKTWEDGRIWKLFGEMVENAGVDVWNRDLGSVLIDVATVGWKLLKNGTDKQRMGGISSILMKANRVRAFPLSHVCVLLTSPHLLVCRVCVPFLCRPTHLFRLQPYESIWNHGLVETWDSKQSPLPVVFSHSVPQANISELSFHFDGIP
ncbi:hypothetical protein K438DRAFT_1584753 [Mycena galopus ATCC 62051]|nr:hypothetical protein K438DRAFT_1584753 [Mycena galopus ATCC 62051]